MHSRCSSAVTRQGLLEGAGRCKMYWVQGIRIAPCTYSFHCETTQFQAFVTVLQGFPEGAAGPILRCKMYWVQGDPADSDSLAKADVAQADAVILGAAESRPPKEARSAFTELVFHIY